VHWALESGIHPKINDTTLRLARILARYTPCRPGMACLVRSLNVKERCVQYHLGYLREAGLLVYQVRGTRRANLPPLASHYRRTIPPAFDADLGVRTVGEGPHRRMTGIADQGRSRIAAYARVASRPRRKTKHRTRTRSCPVVTCTPMQVGSSGISTAATTSLPSDHAPNSQTRGRQLATGVRRRLQLAAELRARVSWLGRTPIGRISWAVREVADAGWSANAVIAWLQLQTPPAHIHRPSGFLIRRLWGATGVWSGPQQREAGILAARENATLRHRTSEADRLTAGAPSAAVAAAIGKAMAEGRRSYRARQARDGLDDLSSRQPDHGGVWMPDSAQWRQAAADVKAVLDRARRTPARQPAATTEGAIP